LHTNTAEVDFVSLHFFFSLIFLFHDANKADCGCYSSIVFTVSHVRSLSRTLANCIAPESAWKSICCTTK